MTVFLPILLLNRIRRFLADHARTPDEAYLARAVDLVDLENRMRALNR